MSKRYEIRACPVCLEQVGDDSYEESASCYHSRYGYVEPITVEVKPLGLESAAGLERFRLEQEQRERDFTAAGWAWYRKLPEEERERAEAESLALMSPIARSFHVLMELHKADLIADLQRQPFWERLGDAS